MKISLKVVIMISMLLIISTSVGYFLGNRHGILISSHHSVEDSIPKTPDMSLGGMQENNNRSKESLYEFLVTLSELITNKKIKTINDLEKFLLITYGPCRGIPEGQCEE